MSTFNHADSSVSDTEETHSGEGSGGVVFLFFLIGLAASLIVGWVVFPRLLYSQKHQPVDFNHVLHNELVSEGCESCHFFREDGTFSGAPKLAQCIECHEDVQGESEEERKFVEDYVKKEIEVPWLIYARQPDCVFFSHAAHVKTGKMECVTCHGEMGESTTLRVYESNRITGYSRDIWGHNIAGFKRNTWDRMKMDDCAECHQQKKEMLGSVQTQKEGCFVCHK
ncbi:MAG: menaquinone reductase multiheme cytochrome c subunit QrcA [Desulfatirhabdiaceae bacterium]